jgi:hypothetical protein
LASLSACNDADLVKLSKKRGIPVIPLDALPEPSEPGAADQGTMFDLLKDPESET